MNKPSIIAVVLLGMLGIVGAYSYRHWLTTVPAARVVPPPVLPDRTPHSAAATRSAVTKPDHAITGRVTGPAPTQDAVDIAASLLPRAQAGDANAQYSLFDVLNTCNSGYRGYFVRGTRVRTVDEALAWASTRPPIRLEDVQQIYDQCHRLMEEQPQLAASATSWLERASANGQPEAEVERARLLLLRSLLAEYGGTASQQSIAQDRADGRELLLKAIKSGDPAVLWAIGNAQGLFGGNGEQAQRDMLAWRLVACERGYDCGPNAAWAQNMCPGDWHCVEGDYGAALIKDFAGINEQGALEDRAREIAEHLAAKDYAGLLPEATGG